MHARTRTYKNTSHPRLSATGNTLGTDNATGSDKDYFDYNADTMINHWCPAWFVFHPMFTTSTSPDKIVANLQIELFTGWEFVPYPRTFAHLARTPGMRGNANSKTLPNSKDMMEKVNTVNKPQNANCGACWKTC